MAEDGRTIGRIENPSWADVERYTHDLADMINASDFKPDFIVGISSGGLIPAVLLGLLMKWKEFHSIDIKRDGDKRIVKPNPLINWAELNGKKILLVEDELVTGRTAGATKEFLEKNGAVVKLACYFAKDFSEVEPDFVLQRGVKREISFPWERFRNVKPNRPSRGLQNIFNSLFHR